MHHLFFVDEVSGAIDERHERVDRVHPLIEALAVLRFAAETDDTGQAISACNDRPRHDQLAQEFFAFLSKTKMYYTQLFN